MNSESFVVVSRVGGTSFYKLFRRELLKLLREANAAQYYLVDTAYALEYMGISGTGGYYNAMFRMMSFHGEIDIVSVKRESGGHAKNFVVLPENLSLVLRSGVISEDRVLCS